jgi:hypothetical protein
MDEKKLEYKMKQSLLTLLVTFIILIAIIFLSFNKVKGEQINSIWGAYSDRIAKIQPNPDDWEISFGFETNHIQFNLIDERENGRKYRGYRIFYTPYSYLQFERIYKEIYEIDITSLRLLYQPFPKAPVFDGIRIGGCMNSDHLQTPSGFGTITFNYKNTSWAIEFNFNDTILWYKMGIPLGKTKHGIATYFYSESYSGYGRKSKWNKIRVGWER